MTNPNRDRPLRTGYDLVPRGLWTAQQISPKERCLLGWLHSHADNFLERLSRRRIGNEFGGGRRTGDDSVKALADAGFLEIVPGDPGLGDRVVLISEAWEALFTGGHEMRPPPTPTRPQNGATTGHETGPQRISTLEPDAVSSENVFTRAELIKAAERIRNDHKRTHAQRLIKPAQADRLTAMRPQPPIQACALALLGEEHTLRYWLDEQEQARKNEPDPEPLTREQRERLVEQNR